MINEEEVEYVSRFTRVRKKGNALFFPDKKGLYFFELCGDVDIEKILMNIVTGEVKIQLRYFVNGEYQSLVIDRKDLTKNGLVSVLPARGVQITENTAGTLLDYLLYREKRTKVDYIHNQIGFTTIKGQRVFLHYDAYSQSGKIRSTYVGEMEIKPKGSIEGELDLIKQEILGNIPLEASWILGFAAPVLSILRDMIALDNVLVHSFGRSSSGKTSSALLSISQFGKPSKSCSNGLFGSWSSTTNALTGRLAGIFGIPMVYDESGIIEGKLIAKQIYQISSGIERKRLTSDSTLRKTARWSAFIISTGETPLLTESIRNIGLRIRVLQFANVVWTSSGESSARITEKLLDNYGNTGVGFVKSLLEYSEDDLLLRFKEAKDHVMSLLVKVDEFSARSSDKIAIIHLTSILINEVFGIGLDEEGILKFLISADESQFQDRNLGFQAYLAIKEQVTQNLNRFVFKDNSTGHQMFSGQSDYAELPRNEIYGRIVADSSKVPAEVWILRNKLDTMIKDAGFTDAEVVLSEWREKGIIDSDKNKFTRKRSLYNNGDAVRVVVMKLKNNEYESLDKESDSTIQSIRSLKGLHIREEVAEVVEEDII